MKKLAAVLAVPAAVIAFVVGVPTTVSAGGWVVVSLDAAPEFREGEAVTVGFTVLRHGVTPENNDDLVVVLSGERGRVHRFDAVQEGALGHHVATIDVPDAGSYSWKVTGSFVDAELGAIEITGPMQAGGPGSGWVWNAVQWGSATVAIAMAGLAGRDVLRTRRRGTPATAA